jgi:hypothetical protein
LLLLLLLFFAYFDFIFYTIARLSTADRYAANGRTETAMQCEDMSWDRLQLPCDVHKVCSVAGKQFELVSDSISALINCALCLAEVGATAGLQSALLQIFSDRLLIYEGEPPEGAILQHRTDVYDLFLSIPKTAASKLFTNTLARKRRRQRIILSRFLNHDLESSLIIHWCGQGCGCGRQPNNNNNSDNNNGNNNNNNNDDNNSNNNSDNNGDFSRQLTLAAFEQYVVPALIPGACPKFPRGKWTRTELSADWAGLLAAHHGLFVDVFALWLTTNQKKPPTVTWFCLRL